MTNFTAYTLALVATFNVFSASASSESISNFEQCVQSAKNSNTHDHEVFRIHSEYFYELEDPREYAVLAVKNWASEFADKRQCLTAMNQIAIEDVKCDTFVAGAPVCRIEGDSGDFIVAKDYVDGSNVILSQHDEQVWPGISSQNDNEPLWMAQPELCYDELLVPGMDSQAHYVDTYDHRYFDDYRYLLARTSRDLISGLAEKSQRCDFQTSAALASDMKCSVTTGGTRVCGLPSTQGGYFIMVSDDNHGMHVIFNRWD